MLPRDHDVNKIFTLENVLIETIKIVKSYNMQRDSERKLIKKKKKFNEVIVKLH